MADSGVDSSSPFLLVLFVLIGITWIRTNATHHAVYSIFKLLTYAYIVFLFFGIVEFIVSLQYLMIEDDFIYYENNTRLVQICDQESPQIQACFTYFWVLFTASLLFCVLICIHVLVICICGQERCGIYNTYSPAKGKCHSCYACSETIFFDDVYRQVCSKTKGVSQIC